MALGTGVMIGAGIFALVGQVGELAGGWMPWAFLAGAVVVLFSTYSYIRYSATNPSSGGIAMLLKAAYGPGVVAGSISTARRYESDVSSTRRFRGSTSARPPARD